MHAEYERLEHKIAETEVARQHAAAIGDRRCVERQTGKIDVFDAQLTQLHQVLFPPAIGSPFEAGPPQIVCDYCKTYVMTEEEAFETGGVCPRCDPNSPGVDPRNPNWSPFYDKPNHRR
jgi:Zn finger protein HypA/HybF involved in hydrogenase expression